MLNSSNEAKFKKNTDWLYQTVKTYAPRGIMATHYHNKQKIKSIK